ncbi:hypothetical protein BH10PSE14_BH10PSE14_31880 [soil metagenome]
MSFDSPETRAILAFLDRIGIPVALEQVAGETALPAMTVRDGALVIDPARLAWPGDILHEAGHIAVTDPALRATLSDVSSDPAEEMATIAWSYAAALAAGIDPRLVFHDQGYRGGGGYLADNFANGSYFGTPMLEYWGMAMPRRDAEAHGPAPYPHMLRWLR